MALEAVVVRLDLRRPLGPVVDRDRPVLDVRGQHLAVLIAAVVVVEEKSLDAHQAMELDPFAQVGASSR